MEFGWSGSRSSKFRLVQPIVDAEALWIVRAVVEGVVGIKTVGRLEVPGKALC